MFRYTIRDNQTGHVFCSNDNYDDMAYTFFHIVDNVYDGDDDGWLTLVDNNTGRATSVVVN